MQAYASPSIRRAILTQLHRDGRHRLVQAGDESLVFDNIRTADSKYQAAQVLVAFLEQLEAQAAETYAAAWRHRRDAWLADKQGEITARRNGNKKNLAGYLVTLAGKVHADGRLLDHLRGLKSSSFHGQVFEPVPAPEPVGTATVTASP